MAHSAFEMKVESTVAALREELGSRSAGTCFCLWFFVYSFIYIFLFLIAMFIVG